MKAKVKKFKSFPTSPEINRMIAKLQKAWKEPNTSATIRRCIRVCSENLLIQQITEDAFDSIINRDKTKKE